MADHKIKRINKGIKAYLTIYMSLSMTVLLSLCLTLIDGARRSTVRLEAELIAEIGLESILAEYHREMLEQYNLFYIDTSYGEEQPSWRLTEQHLKQYLERNCDMEDVFLGDWLYRDLLALQVEEAEIIGIRTAADYQGAVLRNQAIKAVKDDFGIAYLEEIRGWLETIEQYGLDDRDVEEERRQIEEEIQSHDGTVRQLSEEEWVVVDVNNPAGNLGSLRSDGILAMVIEDTSGLSQMSVNMEELFSARQSSGMVNQGNDTEVVECSGWMERLLFQEYLLRYCGHYGEELDKGALQYQGEYLIAGNSHDMDNLKGVVWRISAIREAANALYLFGDEVKCAEAEMAASIAAAAILMPELTGVFKTAILLGWAYAESLYDIKVLLAGGRVPLLKDAESWHYDIGCVFEDEWGETVSSDGTGLSYKDYLRVLMMLTDLDILTSRFMDIAELDIRQTSGNASFRIDGCIDRIEAQIIIRSEYGSRVVITRKRGYG